MAQNYKITSQKQDVQINPVGTGFQHVWEISYEVTGGPSRGTYGTVVVQDSDHNADHVGKIISDKIAALDDVASL